MPTIPCGRGAKGALGEITSSCGMARCDTEGLFPVPRDVEQVLWIPSKDEHLQARLTIRARMGERNHRSKVSMFHALGPYRVRGSIEGENFRFVCGTFE